MITKQWPLKILLVHPYAPFLSSDKLVIAADCTLLLKPEFSQLYDSNVPVLIGCPLLEDPDAMVNKLQLILGNAGENKVIEVFTMEVPCCQALHMMVRHVANEVKSKCKFTHKIVRAFTKDVEDWRPGYIDESMLTLERLAHGR